MNGDDASKNNHPSFRRASAKRSNSGRIILSDRRAFGTALHCTALLIIFLMRPSMVLPSAWQANAALAQAAPGAANALSPAPSETIESKDHAVEMFSTTMTVIDENTVRVSIDYRFEWLNSSRPCDELYVYVDGAYGITMEGGNYRSVNELDEGA